MSRPNNQILTAAQMRAAEAALIAAGTSVDELMRRAGQGAAEWVWRIGGGRSVTVLTGPGNNGGDGWVIAEAIRQRGGQVAVIAAHESATDAARNARAAYQGQVLGRDGEAHGEVFVDCLFGTGLTRALSGDDTALLERLAASHHKRVAVDLPSGVDSDLGLPLGRGLPSFDLTVALGAWKFAHFLEPAASSMGALRLVEIGLNASRASPLGGGGSPEVADGGGTQAGPGPLRPAFGGPPPPEGETPGFAALIGKPRLSPPPVDAHKYTRGLLGVVAGAMPGAAELACRAAQGAGAGYVKLFADPDLAVPGDLVCDSQPLPDALSDSRIAALLVGPGLGRDGAARERLALVLAEPCPAVIDADALVLLGARQLSERKAQLIATPHDGELFALERAFGLDGAGSKVERATGLARASGMVVVAKGPDTVVAAPDGRVALAARASSWLSTAGTGDVLAGTMASRLATGAEPFEAACQAVWLHGEAARLCGAAFSAGQLAGAIQLALSNCI